MHVCVYECVRVSVRLSVLTSGHDLQRRDDGGDDGEQIERVVGLVPSALNELLVEHLDEAEREGGLVERPMCTGVLLQRGSESERRE